jgi:site-specific DNA recombinase
LTDLVKTEEKLSEWDVALHSVTEFLDTSSPVGRFNFRNLASAAELESDLTSQRVKLGMHGLAKANRWPNDDPPLGYNLTQDQKLQINKEEADLVRNIFQTYLNLKSMAEVANQLNENGFTTSNGDDWTRTSVRNILVNELYTGLYQLGNYEEHVEEYRIISDELFELVTDVRYRFKQSKSEMSENRKASKTEKVLKEFKAKWGEA